MYSVDDLAAVARSNCEFSACFEFIGSNSRNRSGESRKFWCVEREAPGGALRIRSGRITNPSRIGGRVSNEGISWEDAWKRVLSKMKKGYSYSPFLSWVSSDGRPHSTSGASFGWRDVTAWASGMPSPLNSICHLNIHNGKAVDKFGDIVCQVPKSQVESILEAS